MTLGRKYIIMAKKKDTVDEILIIATQTGGNTFPPQLERLPYLSKLIVVKVWRRKGHLEP